MMRKIVDAVDAWLCRHSDQISKVACLIGMLFWIIVLVVSITFGAVLIKELVAAREILFKIFIGTWIVASLIIVPPLAAYMARKCYKSSKKFR